MRTLLAYLGPFGRVVLSAPTFGVPLILGVLSYGSPAVGQAERATPSPWQLHPARTAGSWPHRDGSCAQGACSAGGDWGHGCQACAGYYSLAGRLWVRGEYLMWWHKSADLPPLATTSPPDTPIEDAGVLGLPGTDVLAGGRRSGSGVRLGTRLTLGWWLSPCQIWGVETSYMSLGTGTVEHRLTGQERPILARPFFNVQTPAREDRVVLAYPNEWEDGLLHADLRHRLDSVEVLLRRAINRQCDRHWDLLFGYRYARMAEQLTVDSSTTSVGLVSQLAVGTLIEVSDRFHAVNEFHGAELGLAAAVRHCDWTLDVTAKVALGGTRSRVAVDGGTVITVPGADPVSHSAGMLALDSNITTQERHSFSAVPELRVSVAWDLTCRLKATLGYSFLYWSRVARPGDQIDRNLDPSRFPIPEGTQADIPAPAPLFVLTDYWAQGLSLGLDYQF